VTGWSPSGSTASVAPDVLIRQVERLAADLSELSGPVAAQVQGMLGNHGWSRVDDLYLIGAGDSHHAGHAAEMAFETISGIACKAISAQRFADYGAPSLALRPGRPVVIGASASGRTPEVVAAMERAREHGARTIAVTGGRDSPAARAADDHIVLELPDLARSPGIRTYQATLLGLLVIAVELSAVRRTGSGDRPEALRKELAALAGPLEETAATQRERCRAVAELTATSPTVAVLGGGPNLGTALFSAAKLVEALGVAAMAEDLDEWWHVGRRVSPADRPLFVVAPPGRSHARAVQVAAAARRLGRRVIAVVDRQDAAVTRHANAVLPVAGQVREEFSPLLYHLFAGYTAAFVAQRLGRRIFQDDLTGLPRTLEGFAADERR
jgi:glutamine---fructose-6-phosphate transaminase (isomerizing)